MYNSYSRKAKEDPWVRRYDIKEVSKHRKGFTVYKVTSKIFPRNSLDAVTEVVVWKRFSDFKKLHKALSMIHQGLHLKGTFPSFVKTQIFGRFEEKVIEERRQCALRLLHFAAEVPALYNSQPFVKFFEDVQLVQPSSDVPELEEPLQPLKDEQILCNTDGREALGGTWGHRREAEDVSLSSSCSSEERLPSSGGSTSPLTASDFLLFDPLAGTDGSDLRLGGSWLISAIQSCSETQVGSEGTPPVFHFPRPFEEDEESGSEHAAAREMREEFASTIPGRKDSKLEEGKVCEQTQQRYLVEAGQLVSRAGELESEGRYFDAFSNYKEAIGILLNSVRDEEDPARKDAVTRKTARYLAHAEELYERCLSGSARSDTYLWNNCSTVGESPKGDVDQLARFKIVGIVDRVMLVRDTPSNRIKVIKGLCKSGSPYSSGVPNIVPQNIPFMVVLEKAYQTDNAVYLVMEYASAGRLWDSVSAYLRHSPSSPVTADCQTPLLPSINIYSGRKVRWKSNEEPERFIDATDGRSPCYVSIFGGHARFVRPTAESPLPDCGTDSEDGRVKKLEIPDCTEGGCDEIENLISSSKALLQTVDQTLKSTLPDQESVQSEGSVTCQKTNCASTNISEPNREESKALDQRSRHLSSSTGKLDAPQRRLQQVMTCLELSSCTPPVCLPEASVKTWAAQMVVALSHLHLMGIIWQDLRPDNVLLGDKGQILLTYQSRWNAVDSTLNSEARRCLYSAPEVGQICPVTPACDWWSLGALLFELLTGRVRLLSGYTSIHLNFPQWGAALLVATMHHSAVAEIG